MTPRLAALVRKELIRPTGRSSRRGRLPLPPPADPRRRLRRSPQGDPSRAARALRRLARAARRRLVELDESSATTWNKPPATRPSSVNLTRTGRARRRAARGRRPPRPLARRQSSAPHAAARTGARADPAAPARRPSRARPRALRETPQRSSRDRRRGGRAGSCGRRRAGRGTCPRRRRRIALVFRGRPCRRRARALTRAALPLLERQETTPDSSTVWDALGSASRTYRGRFEECGAGSRAGDPPLSARRATHSSSSASSRRARRGPRPADEALRTLDSMLPANPTPRTLLVRAQLLAMLARFEEAWALALPGQRALA